MFEAGSYPSATPDKCLLKGSIATLPGEDSQEVRKQFLRHVETISLLDPWLKYNVPKVRFVGYFAEPTEIPSNHPICLTVAESFREVTNRKPIVDGRLGAADSRFLNKYGQTPTVIFGPGTTSQMHATNEYVVIDDVINAVKILALAIMYWCGV